jgi:hypothetical protein
LSVPNCIKSTSSAELLRRMRAERPRRGEKDGGERDDVLVFSTKIHIFPETKI